MRYQTLRSVSDNHLFVVCRDGTFYRVPKHVRKQGPWQGMRRGEIEKLKPEYRRALARHGYALVKCESCSVRSPRTFCFLNDERTTLSACACG
jgi:hypothetical protein